MVTSPDCPHKVLPGNETEVWDVNNALVVQCQPLSLWKYEHLSGVDFLFQTYIVFVSKLNYTASLRRDGSTAKPLHRSHGVSRTEILLEYACNSKPPIEGEVWCTRIDGVQ